MDTFYSTLITNNEIELSKSESYHCIIVKRKKIKDKFGDDAFIQNSQKGYKIN